MHTITPSVEEADVTMQTRNWRLSGLLRSIIDIVEVVTEALQQRVLGTEVGARRGEVLSFLDLQSAVGRLEHISADSELQRHKRPQETLCTVCPARRSALAIIRPSDLRRSLRNGRIFAKNDANITSRDRSSMHQSIPRTLQAEADWNHVGAKIRNTRNTTATHTSS